jgi:hypothetical protein
MVVQSDAGHTLQPGLLAPILAGIWLLSIAATRSRLD